MAAIWTENTPLSELQWDAEDLTPQNLVGSSTVRYTSGPWTVTVTYPIVLPELTIYQVSIANSASGLAWSGEVDAQGNVSATPGGDGANAPNPASVYCEDQGGTVEIRTGADGGQSGICIFADGSACEEWAFFRGECAPGDSLQPEVNLDREASYGGVTFRYNAELASAAMGETVAAEELWEVIPEHTAFSFSGYALSATFHEAQIRIYPASGFASGGGAANTAAALRTLLDSGQLPTAGGGFEGPGIPFLPPFNAAQLLHTQIAWVTFQNGRGLRFLTEYAQYYAPINNTDLFYTFQGLTGDGQYYVAAILPVSHPALQADASQIPGGNADAFASTYETYANDMALQLAGYGAAEFTPNLALLDAMMASLQVSP
jgi:putative hemolysin